VPHLFHTAVIKDDIAYAKFEKYIADSSYMLANFGFHPASVVNGVWMEGAKPWHCHRIWTIFEACDDITHLALQMNFFFQLVRSSSPAVVLRAGEKRISRRALMRNQDLHITVLDAQSFNWALIEYDQVEVRHRSPIFDKVTHIRLPVIGSYKTQTSLNCFSLNCFSRLSHISVPYYLDDYHKARHLEPFLKMKSLKMLVIAVTRDAIREATWKQLEKWVRKTRETDDRVYIVERHSVYFRDEWEEETRGGERIWDRAVRYTNEWDRRVTA
jgi:hypothetical protein